MQALGAQLLAASPLKDNSHVLVVPPTARSAALLLTHAIAPIGLGDLNPLSLFITFVNFDVL